MRRSRIKLHPFLTFYLRFVLFFMIIHTVFRAVFLIVYHDLGKNVGIGDQFLALVYGLKLDASLTGYILGLPTLILAVFSMIRMNIFKKILGAYAFLIILILIPTYITNLVVYRYWNFPLDRSVLDYLSTPAEMLASIETGALVLLFLIITLIIYGLYFQIYLKCIHKQLKTPPRRSFLAAGLFFLTFFSLILPIRGGLATSPINTGSVYFHQSSLINHSAVNPVWNLFYSFTSESKQTSSGNYYPDHEVQEVLDELYCTEESHTNILNTTTPNIILVILESFGNQVIANLGGDESAAPNLNNLIREGIFFNNFYASGTYTDRAMGAVLAGYPSLPVASILRIESKAQTLPRLDQRLKTAGYTNTFLYGGDIDFGHIKSFVLMGGFDKTISDKDFPPSFSTSNWGVPDHILFQRLAQEADNAKYPFFQVLLTLSSHPPYDVPMEHIFPGSDQTSKYKNSVFYTDQSLGDFIETAKTKDWWNQTLIIFLADHGSRIGNITAFEKKRFNIPMLWVGGALAIKDTIITRTGSQTDLPVTLLNQLKLPYEDFMFSKDLFSTHSKSFAYYTYNDGIGFLYDSSFSIFSLITGKYLQRDHSDSARTVDPGLAFFQYLVKDYNER